MVKLQVTLMFIWLNYTSPWHVLFIWLDCRSPWGHLSVVTWLFTNKTSFPCGAPIYFQKLHCVSQSLSLTQTNSLTLVLNSDYWFYFPGCNKSHELLKKFTTSDLVLVCHVRKKNKKNPSSLQLSIALFDSHFQAILTWRQRIRRQ